MSRCLPREVLDGSCDKEEQNMKNPSAYFRYESIVIATLAILAVSTLTILAHVALNTTAVI
jgi:hypothetical protein